MKRRTRRVVLAAGLFYVLGSAPAWAGVAADPTTPDGIGGLFTVPDLAGGAGKTLFEATGDNDYLLYTDLGLTDVGEKTAVILYAPFLGLGMAMVRLAIGLTWWLNALTSRDIGISNLGESLQTVAANLNVWLLPTALAVGAVIAYGSARAGRDALGQVAWVMGLGIASIAMATSAPQILQGIDGARQLLARTVSAVGSNTSQVSNTPFKWPGANLDTGDDSRDLSRASGDAVWRSFAVVPWCQEQFGSQAACERYGAKWLTLKTDDDRKDFVNTEISRQEGGDDAATVRFIQGHNPSDRIVISLFALVNGIGVLLIIGGLALLALMPWVTALLLLFLATVFLCLLCVPGRPRHIGMTFLNTVAGLVLLSALSTGVLTGALLAVTAVTSIAPTQGWLPAAVMTMAILIAAWHARSILERIVFVAGASAGSRMGGLAAATGYLAMRRAFSRSPRSNSGTKPGAPRGGSGPETAGTTTSRRGAGPSTPRFASYGRGNGRASGAAASAGAGGGQGHTPTATTNPRGAWQRGNGHPDADPSRWHPRESGTSPSRRPTSRTARPDVARARERLARRERGEAPPSRGSYASRYEQPTRTPRAKDAAQPKGPRFTDYTSQQRRSRAKSTSAGPANRPQPRWSRSRRRDEGQE